MSAVLAGPGEVVATGPISASGAFSLLLPDALAGTLLGAIGACGAVTVVPSGVRGAGVQFLLVSDVDGEELGLIAHTNMDNSIEPAEVGDAVSFRRYVDRAATILGTCVEFIGDEVMTHQWNLDLSRGWNVVTIALTAVTEGERALEVRVGAPSSLPWRFFDVVQPPPDPTGSSPTPVPIASDLVYVDVGAGFAHTCAVAEDGATLCWGLNEHGQPGSATDACDDVVWPLPCSYVPIEIGGRCNSRRSSGALSIAAGLTTPARPSAGAEATGARSVMARPRVASSP